MLKKRFASTSRQAAVLLGFAALLALGLGLGRDSAGLASVGEALLLGKQNNAAGKATSLVADLSGSTLRVTNDGKGPALDLNVEPGRAPLVVPANAGKATNLNADQLDGQDASGFIQPDTKTYTLVNSAATGPGPANPTASNSRSCDDGDRILTGGVTRVSDNGEIVASSGFADGWSATVRRIGNASATIDFRAVYLDFPPLHRE